MKGHSLGYTPVDSKREFVKFWADRDEMKTSRAAEREPPVDTNHTFSRLGMPFSKHHPSQKVFVSVFSFQ